MTRNEFCSYHRITAIQGAVILDIAKNYFKATEREATIQITGTIINGEVDLNDVLMSLFLAMELNVLLRPMLPDLLASLVVLTNKGIPAKEAIQTLINTLWKQQ